MDKERARFILSCFRPDGADAGDADFADALRLAAGDRELGEWLARERARDAAFASALREVEIPAEMRDAILACLANQRNDVPQAEDGFDAALVGALASWRPPDSLRGNILAAMERTPGVRPAGTRRWWLAAPLAAAAGIALAWLAWPVGPAAQATAALPVAALEDGFIRTFESPRFSLDLTKAEHQQLFEHLKRRSLPCPGCLPPGLRDVPGIGCRELVIDGKRGAIMCFDQREAGAVHLVVFRREDVRGQLPCRENPSLDKHGRWAVARWADAEHAFILLGNTDVRKLASLF